MSGAKAMLLGVFRSQSKSERGSQKQHYGEAVRYDSSSSRCITPTHRQESKHHQELPSRELHRTPVSRAQHPSEGLRRPSPTSATENQPETPLINSLSTASAKWPPEDFTNEDSLSQQQAENLITVGVPIYNGCRVFIPHATQEYFAQYATCVGPTGANDAAKFYCPAFAAMTCQIYGGELASQPWDTLEQPSLAFCYGERPGTITLNHWTSLCGKPRPTIALRDPGFRPRDVDLATIIDRLIHLEGGFEEDHEDLMYKNLYKTFLKDPDRLLSPHKAMEKQIADLIVALSGPQWIDFSDQRNQVVAKFFAHANFFSEEKYKLFFHQLLLSIELDFRINSRHHGDAPKQKLLSQLPPCIAWDLALSRRWRECIRIENVRKNDRSMQIDLHLRVKKRQVKALRKFVRAMKWPSITEVDEILRSKDHSVVPLQDRSADAMSYFSGVILPGATLPFLLMNALVDSDRDNTGSDLDELTHIHPNCGFQYRSSTYWSSTCIVGKVLAPSCREIAGWIGPAMSTQDLARVEIARVRQRRLKQQMSVQEVKSMRVRSDPLGPPPPDMTYPVVEYQLVLPDVEDEIDTVRVERLELRAALPPPASNEKADAGPRFFDACIRFAIDGRSWPLHLAFNASYISACPCNGGPHPLFYDYVYRAVKVDELVMINGWGALFVKNHSNSGGVTSQHVEAENDDNEIERVLVVEAFGVLDNEILARAWASHWGLSAVIADVSETCMACSIREAYAACLNVVILIGGPPSSQQAYSYEQVDA